MWRFGAVDAAEGRLGSCIVEDLLVPLHSRMQRAPKDGERVLVAAISDHLHDVGARRLADRFAEAGWDTLFLGADVPGVDLACAATDCEVDLVALSVGGDLNLRATARGIEAVRTASGDSIPVLVGGRPFQHSRGLQRDVGADAGAGNAPAVLREAARPVGLGA